MRSCAAAAVARTLSTLATGAEPDAEPPIMPLEVVAHYPDCWAPLRPDAVSEPRASVYDDPDVRLDRLVQFVLEGRRWRLVDLGFALLEIGDAKSARALAAALCEHCPRLSRRDLLRLQQCDGGAEGRIRRPSSHRRVRRNLGARSKRRSRVAARVRRT